MVRAGLDIELLVGREELWACLEVVWRYQEVEEEWGSDWEWMLQVGGEKD